MSMRPSSLKSTLLVSGIVAMGLACAFADDAKKSDMFGDGKTKFSEPAAPDPIADAKKLVLSTRKDKDKADNAFNALVKKLKADYEQSDDYKKFVADAKAADDAYNAACAPILATLATDPKYSVVKADHDSAQKELDAMLKKGDSTTDDRTDVSARINSTNQKMNDMQQKALDAADSIKDLKTADDAAKAAVVKAKKDFETTLIRENPEWIKARQDQATASAAATAARQALATLQNPPATESDSINNDIAKANAPAAPAKTKTPMTDKKGHVIPGYYK
jgi:hypothetical protein